MIPAGRTGGPVRTGGPTGAGRPAGPGMPVRVVRPRGLGRALLVNGVLPLVVYALLRPYTGSDAVALAVAAAIPVAGTLAGLVRRRRPDPIGALAVAGFGVALVVLWLSGGNPLVLKLQDSVVTGPLGVACLVSVVVRRPLSLLALRRMARGNPGLRERLAQPGHRRAATVLTALLGGTMLLHAVALLVLALSVPTGTFLALSRPVGASIVGVGVAAMIWYRRRLGATRGGAPGRPSAHPVPRQEQEE